MSSAHLPSDAPDGPAAPVTIWEQMGGLLIAAVRLIRHKPVTQAVAGLFGVGLAAFIAHRTGSAKGYFLFGIWSFAAYGSLLLVSILVRWPLIGVLWEGVNGRGRALCRTSCTRQTRSAGWPPRGC